MQRSESIQELATALAKAQGAMQAAKKDAANPFFKSNYADLADVVEAIRAPLASNGLSYVQPLTSDDSGAWIETVLMHTSGEWISSRVRIVVTKPNDPQSFGSATTYFRRYALQAMVGVPAEDDDGNAAQPPQGQQNGQQQAKRKPPRQSEQQQTDKPPAQVAHEAWVARCKAAKGAKAFNELLEECKAIQDSQQANLAKKVLWHTSQQAGLLYENGVFVPKPPENEDPDTQPADETPADSGPSKQQDSQAENLQRAREVLAEAEGRQPGEDPPDEDEFPRNPPSDAEQQDASGSDEF